MTKARQTLFLWLSSVNAKKIREEEIVREERTSWGEVAEENIDRFEWWSVNGYVLLIHDYPDGGFEVYLPTTGNRVGDVIVQAAKFADVPAIVNDEDLRENPDYG